MGYIMATWDFGGCPCGLSRECDCANAHKYNPDYEKFKQKEKIKYKAVEEVANLAHKQTNTLRNAVMSKREEYDFGFSAVSEEDFKPKEDKTKLYGLRDMIMPLLNNLMKDSHKNTIVWPNRKERIEEFIKKIDEYIEK